MLNCWPNKEFTAKHLETVPCLHMLAEVARRLQEARTEPAKANRAVGGRTWTDFSDSTVGRRVFSSTWSWMTSKKAIEEGEFTNSSQHWPGNITVDGTSPRTHWSRCDTQRNARVIHADHNVEYLSKFQSAPPIQSNFFPKSSSSHNASQALTKKEEPDDNKALESQTDGERRSRRIRKVGMNLTATVLFTCSQVCQEWNISKIVQPSRVDVLEVGGSTNSVLIDEVSKLKWSWHCVNQQTGYDLHRLVDAKRAAEWAIEHKPRVAWFRIRCCCWDGAENEKHFLQVWSGDQEHGAE